MEMGSILLIRLCIKENGVKVRKKGKGKLYLKVEVYFKVVLKMILKKALEKCIIILQEIISKGNGKMIKNKDMGR
jgi:hypothetical protein